MTHLLPPNLLKLFAPRPPLPYFKPLGRDPDVPLNKSIDGVAAVLERIRLDAAGKGNEEKENEENETFTLCEEEKIKERRAAKLKKREEDMKKGLETYDPKADPHAGGDPYRTLFISRLSYQATEADLRREFEMYGPIEKLTIVKDKNNKSRGYAFILYEREKDMKGRFPNFFSTPFLPPSRSLLSPLSPHTKTQTASRFWAVVFSSMSSVDAQSKVGSHADWVVD
ncbi:hypothetical protein BT69DRAFT_542491 [Atractiella rhizophila]|nr:hypothetical protein BT69DRAFT_542491 [Atractiella rhizophila]